jgi:alkanesulfonate monooxygenase SsuD/methylene tetrahydromethanopterin reductase-like flavin-dependent oxidoreductase (luciferase family)
MERTGTNQPLHLGVWYDFRNPVPWRIGWQQLYNETLDQARWAEELGFNSVWLSEHHFTNDGYMPSIPVNCRPTGSASDTAVPAGKEGPGQPRLAGLFHGRTGV